MVFLLALLVINVDTYRFIKINPWRSECLVLKGNKVLAGWSLAKQGGVFHHHHGLLTYFPPQLPNQHLVLPSVAEVLEHRPLFLLR